MMLSYQTIKRLVDEGEISITPFCEDNIGPASYDLTLDNSFVEVKPDFLGVEMSVPRELLPPELRNLPNNAIPTQKQVRVRTMDEPYKTNLVKVEEGKGIIIPPKCFILASTREYIKVSNSYALYVEGRSSIGRMGLQVQNAGFVDPGFEGQITLELFNASDVPIAIMPGRRICQVTFIKLDEPTEKLYEGKYKGQTDATASRIEEDREVPKVEKRTGIHLL